MQGVKREWTRTSKATSIFDAAPRMDAAVPRLPHRPIRKLHHAARCAQRNDPTGFASSANVKLFDALSQLMLEVIPQDPSRDAYRQGTTLSRRHRHWRRARIGRRFRLFFRYDTRAKVIVNARVNDQSTLRSSGSRTDP